MQADVIHPGSTIGILGGGQLGRMTAMAARTLGYDIHVLDPSADCAAAGVVDRVVAAQFDDADAGAELARHCDVVTFEIEHIHPSAIAAVAHHAPLRPSGTIMEVVQDRGVQKQWLTKNGFPCGPYREVQNVDELAAAARDLGSLFVKSCRGGYDGRGQARLQDSSKAAIAWKDIGERRAVAEQALDLEAEISVMVARSPGGEVRVYPPAFNVHERQILAWSCIPADVPPNVASNAEEIARGIAEQFDLQGLLAVEMFLVRDGRLLVNELAPRPHNSYHESEVACGTSQFEQLVRAVCNLPLGDPGVLRPGAIFNLFGELWAYGSPDFTPALALPGVRLHLYGKRGARAGRKMGHLSATGDTPAAALALVRQAASAIRISRPNSAAITDHS